MKNEQNGDLGFSYRALKNGTVFIYRDGKTVTTLSNKRAADFLAKVEGVDNASAQQIMARVTGNYKRGNEKTLHHVKGGHYES